MGKLLQFFREFPEVIAVTSSRFDLEMGSSTNPGPENEFLKNRESFLAGKRIPPDRVVMAGLAQGRQVRTVTEIPPERHFPDSDGLVTVVPEIGLTITHSDCFPIFLVEPEQRIIGIAHAGREGVFAGVLGATIQAMGELGAVPKQIHVAIGPGICHQCYVIQDDERGIRRFIETGNERFVSRDGDGTFRGDLLGILREDQIPRLGLKLDRQDEFPPPCTAHPENDRRFFSYRRDRPEPGNGANMISAIMLRRWLG